MADFESAVSDHARLLGRAPAWSEWALDRGSRSAFFALGNLCLEVCAGTPREAGTGAASDRGLVALVLEDDEEGGPSPWDGAAATAPVPLSAPERRQAERSDAEGVRRWSLRTVEPRASRGLALELLSGQRFEGAASPPLGARRDAGAGAARDAGAAREGAGFEPGGPARVAGLDHVVVLSADVESSRRLYADGLGLRLALDRSFPERGLRVLFFRVAGVTIEVAGRLDAEPRPELPDRFGGLAWRVPDVDAIRARLAAEGFDVSAVRQGHKPGTRVCTVRAPVHAVPTLLVEPAPPARDGEARTGAAGGEGAHARRSGG